MSLIDSTDIPNLFLNNNISDNFFLPKDIGDNLNDILDKSKNDIIPSKQIKFVLTKESPSINLLQKKTFVKVNKSKILIDNSNSGRWNKEEQKRFAEAILKFGNDWKKIQNNIFSRNITQVRSHAQKFLMKLKENNVVKNKGVEQSMSWTKAMNYLRNILSYNELKEIVFSVEKNDDDKINKKKLNKKKKITKKYDSNSDINFEHTHFFFEDKEDTYNYALKNKIIIKNEEDEEQILKKFIECFNSDSGEITLNTSFEESSNIEENNDIGCGLLNESSIL
jgi:SHAQKYF class myb-like DNA-binding protein